jgi:hypothetical protein
MASDNAFLLSAVIPSTTSEAAVTSTSGTSTPAATIRMDIGGSGVALPPLYDSAVLASNNATSSSSSGAGAAAVGRGSSSVGVETERGEKSTNSASIVPLVFRPRLKRLSILPKKRKSVSRYLMSSARRHIPPNLCYRRSEFFLRFFALPDLITDRSLFRRFALLFPFLSIQKTRSGRGFKRCRNPSLFLYFYSLIAGGVISDRVVFLIFDFSKLGICQPLFDDESTERDPHPYL